MTATVPIDSLMRFLQATPEQRAAFDRFLRERNEEGLKVEGDNVILGQPFTFDKSNIDQFNF